jgi:hypothetical protein
MSQEFWDEFLTLLKPVVPVELEHRVYYDEQGNITSCSMQQHAEGNYLVVTEDQYNNYFQYRVVKNSLVKIDSDAQYRVRLLKSNQGVATVKGHAGILIEDETYSEIEYYARNN